MNEQDEALESSPALLGSCEQAIRHQQVIHFNIIFFTGLYLNIAINELCISIKSKIITQ